MTEPFARPDPSDSDETIPLVPDSGYAAQVSPWSSGYEATAIDPLAGSSTSPGGYTNPVIPGGYPNPSPASTSPYGTPAAAPHGAPAPPPYATPPAPSPLSLPQTAPNPLPYAPAPTAPVYEQPPTGYGAGPFEPAREMSRAQPAPGYGYVYAAPVEHPNAVPTLVLGLLGFMFGITFPIAWYLGAKGNAEVKREPHRYRSSGIMNVGMVLGIVGSMFMILAVLLVVLGLVAIIATG